MSTNVEPEAGASTLEPAVRAGLLHFVRSDPSIWADPHPTYHCVRAAGPLPQPTYNEVIFTRFDHCEAILRDPRFSSDPSNRVVPDDAPLTSMPVQANLSEVRSLLFLDPPDHTRIRSLVSKGFTPRRVEALRPHIEQIRDDILNRAADEGTLDIVNDLGYQLPVTVICELLGVPLEDRDRFGPWSSAASRLLDGDSLTEADLNAGLLAFMELVNYFNALFAERRAHPRDDLISALLAAEEAGDRLDEMELHSIVLLLFVAGHETTMNLIGNGMLALLRHPDQLRLLRDRPDLTANAIEELLRYDGPVHLTGRTALEDLEVDGYPVRAGQGAITLLAAANRDPLRHEAPDELHIDRPDPRHLTFSHGIHYCLGASLARVEGQSAIGGLVERFGSIEAIEEPVHRAHFVLRGLESLRVAVS